MYLSVQDGTWEPVPVEIVIPDVFGPNGTGSMAQTVRMFSPRTELQAGSNTTETDNIGRQRSHRAAVLTARTETT